MTENDAEVSGFSYTYSGKGHQGHAEVEAIRKKYLPPKEDKMETLRRLDRGTKKTGNIVAITVGTVGCLLFGLGMSCALVWEDTYFVLGIILSIVGLVVMLPAYTLYKKITKKQQEKVAGKILALIEEMEAGEVN